MPGVQNAQTSLTWRTAPSPCGTCWRGAQMHRLCRARPLPAYASPVLLSGTPNHWAVLVLKGRGSQGSRKPLLSSLPLHPINRGLHGVEVLRENDNSKHPELETEGAASCRGSSLRVVGLGADCQHKSLHFFIW